MASLASSFASYRRPQTQKASAPRRARTEEATEFEQPIHNQCLYLDTQFTANV
jgi:hypothetical protein